MKNLLAIFVCFLLLISNSVQAQLGVKNINPNQIEVSLYNGVGINKVKSLSGPDKPENSIGLNHDLNVCYNRLITNDLSMSIGWGFGFQAFTFKLKEKTEFYGTENLYYWQNAEYNIYHKLVARGIYNLQVNSNTNLRFTLGGGIYQYLPTGLGVCSSNINDIYEYDLHISYYNNVIPVAVIGLNYIFTLDNKNELGLGFNINHSFKNIYDGSYELYDNTSDGELFNTGSSVGINVSYIFTGNDTYHKTKLRSESMSDEKAARKEVNKEKRFLSPEATFVSIYGGLGSGITKNSGLEFYLKNAGVPEFYAGVNYEHGLKNNFYFSGGYKFLQYYHSVGVISLGMSSGGSLFTSHEFDLGAGYRVISNRNYKLLNINLGIVSGFSNGDIGEISNSGMSVSHIGECSECFYKVTSTGEIVSKLIFGAYFGVSKDFRLTDFFYLSLNYRYQHGFNPVFEGDVICESSDFEGIKTATQIVDGTAHLFNLGLKFRFR